MIGLFPAILLGALIVALGFYFLVQGLGRRQKPAVTIDEYSRAREALDAVFVQTSAIERIFSVEEDRKSTRLNSSHQIISYAVFCLKKKTAKTHNIPATQ